MVSCSKCYSNDIDALAWVNLVTSEITEREDQYHCNNCGSTVEVILTPDMDWIEDIEPIKEEENEKETEPTVRVSARMPKHLDTTDE